MKHVDHLTPHEEHQHWLLLMSLEAAVPMWLAELDKLPASLRSGQLDFWRAHALEEVAAHGDVLMYGGKKGDAAKAFNWLARGLAALSTNPGGVAFLGRVWCADHSPGGAPRGESQVCHRCAEVEAA
jgi:hypothetical protein